VGFSENGLDNADEAVALANFVLEARYGSVKLRMYHLLLLANDGLQEFKLCLK
jgi:hypothetical protein